MLIASVILYLALTVAIGLWAARRVHNSRDFVLAGRSLPLYMSAATVFATWFGAETVLSVSATFTRDGLGGIVADPFGSSFCLLFVALFGLGSVAAMAALSGLAGWHLARLTTRPGASAWLQLSAGVLSLVVGLLWL